jgi:hypothetical protein
VVEDNESTLILCVVCMVFCSDIFTPRDETDPTERASDSYKKCKMHFLLSCCNIMTMTVPLL